MTVPKHFLSQEQDVWFDECIKKWAPVLGLSDWTIYRRSNKARAARADIEPLYEARQAGYRTGNFGALAPDDKDIEETAVHELMHVVLAELIHVAANFEDDVLLNSAEHRVVNTITALLMTLKGTA